MMITTTHGEMDDSTLRKVEGQIENDTESTYWVEYYLDDELVHRSVHVTLKQWPDGLGGELSSFGD